LGEFWGEVGTNLLRNLNESEISMVRTLFHKYTLLIKLLFCAITVQILRDVMLDVCTMLWTLSLQDVFVTFQIKKLPTLSNTN
jgi:hypothetical protein